MRQKIHDIIAISNSVGHPDIFITICNPYWPKIQNTLLPRQRAGDRSVRCDRVFRMKLNLLLKHLTEDEPFGQITAFVSVVEFQQRRSRASSYHYFPRSSSRVFATGLKQYRQANFS